MITREYLHIDAVKPTSTTEPSNKDASSKDTATKSSSSNNRVDLPEELSEPEINSGTTSSSSSSSTNHSSSSSSNTHSHEPPHDAHSKLMKDIESLLPLQDDSSFDFSFDNLVRGGSRSGDHVDIMGIIEFVLVIIVIFVIYGLNFGN